MLADRSLAWLSSEELHPETDLKRCRSTQPNSGWRLGTLENEKEEGLQPGNGRQWIGTPQEVQQNQLT